MTDDGFLRLDRELIEAAQKTEYNTYDELVQAYNAMSDENRKKTLFVVGRRYYINYNEGDKNSLREVNLYADLIRNPESETSASLRIVPAKIVQYNIGTYTFLSHNFDYVRTDTPLFFNIPVVSFHKVGYEQSAFNIQEAIEGNVELQEKQKRVILWRLRSIPVYSTVIPLTGNHLIMLIRLPITNKDLKGWYQHLCLIR